MVIGSLAAHWVVIGRVEARWEVNGCLLSTETKIALQLQYCLPFCLDIISGMWTKGALSKDSPELPDQMEKDHTLGICLL